MSRTCRSNLSLKTASPSTPPIDSLVVFTQKFGLKPCSAMASSFSLLRSGRLRDLLKVSRGQRFYCATASKRNPKVFAQYTLFKGKSAIAFNPGRATFKTIKDGSLTLEKEGCIYMEVAPSTGPRLYDWSQKQVMALSVAELGTLMTLNMSESMEIFHDPRMGTSDAGKMKKCLKVEPMPDKSGFFFNFDVTNKADNLDMHFCVPVTKGEFAVLRSSFNFMIPHLLGWHVYVNSCGFNISANNRVDSNQEWAK